MDLFNYESKTEVFVGLGMDAIYEETPYGRVQISPMYYHDGIIHLDSEPNDPTVLDCQDKMINEA